MFAVLGLWFVCALGATVFAAVARATRGAVVEFAVAFVATAIWSSPDRLPGPAAVGVIAAIAAAMQLVRPGYRFVPWLLAGALAGVWTGVLELQGVPALLSPLVASALPVAAALLAARRREFATALLREEALLFTCVLGFGVAMAPSVLEGWRAAANLTVQNSESAPVMVPAWTISIAAAAPVIGGLYSLWSRR